MNKLMETAIPQYYTSGLYNDRGFDVAENLTPIFADILFVGVTSCLAAIKSKDKPTAFVFEKDNGDLIAAAVIQFVPNEDPENPGNWNYFWTWYKEDVPEDALVVSITKNINLVSYFRGIAQHKYGIGFEDTVSLNEITRYFLETIEEWLENNASETGEVGVEMDGVFQARVVVENGEKVKSIEPAGEIKKMIKDDAAIEV